MINKQLNFTNKSYIIYIYIYVYNYIYIYIKDFYKSNNICNTFNSKNWFISDELLHIKQVIGDIHTHSERRSF